MGRVEICNNQTFGTICDDFWNELDAAVVCRQLNFSTAGRYGEEREEWGGGYLLRGKLLSHQITSSGAVEVPHSYFGAGNGKIILDNVKCVGTEASVLECQHSPIGTHNCSPNEVAGVICGGKQMGEEGKVRVVSNSSPITVLYIPSSNHPSPSPSLTHTQVHAFMARSG